MLKGTCPYCETIYYGWALREPENQTCGECGAKLLIDEVSTPLKVPSNGNSEKDPLEFLRDIL